ncbi:MAG: hypothetical protein K1X57_06350 [Gemmataceae bacterium]|nr:hypothetical protein [Gemmataceae bacterium]
MAGLMYDLGQTEGDEKARAIVLDALKAALATPGEQRLYRSGKLPGLLAVRSGAYAQAARILIDEKLVEIVSRSEAGRTAAEWVRITPVGVDYLHARESPRAVLAELHDALAVTRAGVPVWLDDVRRELAGIGDKLAKDVAAMTARLDALASRVDEALRRADARGPGWPEKSADVAPWAVVALSYLDRRRETGMPGPCPLPELYGAIRRREPLVSLADFQTGLHKLAETKALRLLPHTGPMSELTEPEYAIVSGLELLYYAVR